MSRFYSTLALKREIRVLFERSYLPILKNIYKQQKVGGVTLILVKEFFDIFFKLTLRESPLFYAYTRKKECKCLK